VEGEQELVVKGLDEHLGLVPNIAGATVLATGRIAPLLNVADVVRGFSTSRMVGQVFEEAAAAMREKKRVLIVDDSITTRTLEKSILEAVGYAVSVATDGQDAIARLRERPFDLVLSDVQMPRMDGIELVTRIRRDERLRNTPVVLVSSLASDDDKKRGLDAGANAYIGKSEFRQEVLLATLERLV
jgi:two-component system chemotaxis sensor kinase CheA